MQARVHPLNVDLWNQTGGMQPDLPSLTALLTGKGCKFTPSMYGACTWFVFYHSYNLRQNNYFAVHVASFLIWEGEGGGGGIVSYTSRGKLKECKIMSRADFQIIIALLPRKKNMHKTNFIRDEHRTLVSPTGVDNVLQKSVLDKSTAFGLQFLYG